MAGLAEAGACADFRVARRRTVSQEPSRRVSFMARALLILLLVATLAGVADAKRQLKKKCNPKKLRNAIDFLRSGMVFQWIGGFRFLRSSGWCQFTD